jgi:hypothetical protein
VVGVSSAAAQQFLETAAPQTRLLEQRRQIQATKAQLIDAKGDFEERSLSLRIREEALFRKDLELQDALLRLNPLLDENQAKKIREEKRAVDEERERELKEGEVADALLALEAARAEADQLVVAKRRLQRYHTYMAAFQRFNADEFPDLGSILERNAALSAANGDLKQESARLAERLDEARRVLAQGQKARATHALTSENLTARLKERLETVRAEVARLSTSVEKGAAVASGRAFEFGQMLRSVANLHARCAGLDVGSVVHHAPEDAEVLGRGTASLFEGLVEEMEGESGAGASAPAPLLSLTAALGDSGAPRGATAAAASATTTTITTTTTALGRATLGRAPVFVAQADPSFFAATLGATAAADTGKKEEEGEEAPGAGNTGMEPKVLVRNVRSALGLLGVVGSYIEDLQAMADEYAPFQAAQRKAAAAKAAAAAEEAKKRAAAEAAKAKTAAKRESLISGGGGGAPARLAPPRPSVSPLASASASAAASSARAPAPPGGMGASSSLSGSLALNSASVRASGRPAGVPPTRSATVGGRAPATGAADALAASGPAVTAEALRIKRELERQSVKTYFAAVSPFPPPVGAVLGSAGGGGGGGGPARGAGLGDSKMKGSLQLSQSLASSSKMGAPFASKAGAPVARSGVR